MGHRNAARQRNKKFKQTRVQTFGGKKTNFSNAEKKRITDAGYSVSGYSSAPAKSNTQLQVDKDNAMYGNTVPSGSFSISAAGRAQAEANKKEAAAKAAAAKKEATRKSAFDPNRLSFNMNSNPFTGQSFLAGGYNQPGRAGSWFDKGLNERVPNEANASFGRLFKDDMSQLGKFTNKQGKVEGGLFNTGIPKNFNQVKQLFSGKGGLGFSFGSGIDTGPTPLGRQFARRFLPYAGQISLGKDIFNQGATDSATTNLMNSINTGVTNLTGGRLTANNPETDIGARAGRFFTSLPGRVVDAFSGGDETKVASTDAGGLNIGGGVDSEGGSSTGRTVVTTDRDKNINYDVGGIAKDVGLGLADFATFNKFDFDNLGRPSDNKTVDQQIATFKKSPLQQAILSKQLGIDANRMITEGGAASDEMMKRYFSQVTTEGSAKDARNPIARFLRDVGDTPATQMAGRAQDAFKYNDPNFSDDPNKLTKFLSSVSGIPNLSEENVQDIRHTFNTNVTAPTGIEGKSMLKNVPYNQALGFANRLPSGMLKDAMVETMDTQGLTKFNSVDDVVNVGSQMFDPKTQGPVAKEKLGDLQNLVDKYGPGKGQLPTIPSIIKGIGGAVGRRGGSGSPMQIQGRSGMTATLPAAVQQEYPLPIIPQTGVANNNLQNIQQNAYSNQMNMYARNPNYFAQFRPQQRFPRRGSFRSSFIRDYFN